MKRLSNYWFLILKIISNCLWCMSSFFYFNIFFILMPTIFKNFSETCHLRWYKLKRNPQCSFLQKLEHPKMTALFYAILWYVIIISYTKSNAIIDCYKFHQQLNSNVHRFGWGWQCLYHNISFCQKIWKIKILPEEVSVRLKTTTSLKD